MYVCVLLFFFFIPLVSFAHKKEVFSLYVCIFFKNENLILTQIK